MTIVKAIYLFLLPNMQIPEYKTLALYLSNAKQAIFNEHY